MAGGLTGWLLLRQRDRLDMVRGGVAILIEALVSTLAFHRPFAAGFGPAWVGHAAFWFLPEPERFPRVLDPPIDPRSDLQV